MSYSPAFTHFRQFIGCVRVPEFHFRGTCGAPAIILLTALSFCFTPTEATYGGCSLAAKGRT